MGLGRTGRDVLGMKIGGMRRTLVAKIFIQDWARLFRTGRDGGLERERGEEVSGFFGRNAGLRHVADGVKEAEDGGRVGLERGSECVLSVIEQGGEHLGGGDFAANAGDLVGVCAGLDDEFSGEFGKQAGSGGEVLFAEVVLVSAIAPAGEFLFGESVAIGAEALGDFGVGDAFIEHAVNGILDWNGEAGDVARAAAARPGGKQFGEKVGGFGLGRDGCSLSIHFGLDSSFSRKHTRAGKTITGVP